MRLDFTNDRLNKWISECPFPIDVKQSMVEPTGCRQLNIAVTIPDTAVRPNPDAVRFNLADLELRYMDACKKRDNLCHLYVCESNALKKRKLEKEWRQACDLCRRIEGKLEEAERV